MSVKKFCIKFLSAFIPSSAGRKAFRKRHKPKPQYDFQTDYGFTTQNSSPLIIDCGANMGESVLFFKKTHPKARIEAYEADPNLYTRKLLPNLNQGGRLPTGINCHNKAVWINDEGVQFYPDGGVSGSCIKAPCDSNMQKPIRVGSVRLKDILKKHDRVDFLKLDIEGAELFVLQDCQEVLQKVDRIFVEYHSFVGCPQELSQLLSILETESFRYRIDEDYNPTEQYWDYQGNGNNMDCQLKIYALNTRVIQSD